MPAEAGLEGRPATAGEAPTSASGTRLDEIRERARALTERRVPTLVLALIVSIATWTTTIALPGGGLDPSWGGGLYIALDDGLAFGPDVAWTYGPLGFLFIPVNWDTTLTSLSFILLSGLRIALAFGIVWTLRRTVGAVAATVIAFGVLALLIFVELPFPVAALLCYAALARDRPRYAVEALVVLGATLSALLMLIKLSLGPAVLAMCFLGLIGARAGAARIAAFLALFLVELVGLWLLSGQALGDLGDYVVNGLQVISGYSEAMIFRGGTDTEATLSLIGAFVTLLAFVGGAALAGYRDGIARVAGILIALGVGFSAFKEGVVRQDSAHLALYFSTIVTLWMVLPWGRALRLRFAAGALALAAIAVPATFQANANAIDGLDVPASVNRAYDQIDSLLSPSERTANSAFAGAFMQVAYDIDPEILEQLGDRTVSVEPFELGAVYAYDLNWEPLPVFQGYTAYTSELDELNAEAVADPDGPETILRGTTPPASGQEAALTIDGRFPGWDPPAQAIAEICNFETATTIASWQLLERVPDRCSEPEPAGSVDAAFGDTVEVPQAGPGEVVFARIEGAGVGGLEKLRSLLFRAEFRYARVDDERTYRLVPGTAGDGLLMNGDPSIVGTGDFAQAPQAERIALTGPSGDLRYDFFSMEVEETTPAPGKGS